MTLYPRGKKFVDRSVTLLADGQIEVDGEAFASPSDAAATITGKRTNGWWFFRVDAASRRSLRDVRSDYISAMDVDVDDDEVDDNGDDD